MINDVITNNFSKSLIDCGNFLHIRFLAVVWDLNVFNSFFLHFFSISKENYFSDSHTDDRLTSNYKNTSC